MKKLVVIFLILTLILLGCAKKKKPIIDNQLQTKQDTITTLKSISDLAIIHNDQLKNDAQSALNTIYFDFDASFLTEEARGILISIGNFMKKYPEVKMKIEGHCDDRGSAEYNMALGQKRADEAKQYLVTYGIASDLITTISWGEERPAIEGDNESAWSKNRRDEFSYEIK
jgi:peptidoglycan-associated lipoprotein